MADNDPPQPEEGKPYRVRRPETSFLDSRSVVPRDNVVRPPPNRFTHTVTADQPYWYDSSTPGGPPDGIVPAGTAVVLLVRTGDRCRIVTPAGLYVAVACTHLRPLPDADVDVDVDVDAEPDVGGADGGGT
ncbi:hypothetical protein ACWGB8_08535 [Kitasatospora sp. NPDC054939]